MIKKLVHVFNTTFLKCNINEVHLKLLQNESLLRMCSWSSLSKLHTVPLTIPYHQFLFLIDNYYVAEV